METKYIQKIEDLHKQYKSLNLYDAIDYEKYKLYAIVTSSTQLEGATLTELDTQLLLDEGITATGKPLEHHNMVKDNYEAMKFAMKNGDEKVLLSPEFLKRLNAINMSTTGTVVNNIRGSVDGRKGEFRLVNAFSHALGYYLDPPKISSAIDEYCKEFNIRLVTGNTIELLLCSFDAHANLILIHPWQDGNKRTSRLVMNYIQRRSDIPLTKMHVEDGKLYLETLKIAKDEKNLNPFREFMLQQHIKTLETEIVRFKKQQERNKGGFSLIL